MKSKLLLLSLLLAEGAFAAVKIDVACDRPEAVYAVGETVTFTVTGRTEGGELLKAGKFFVSVDNFGSRSVIAKREYDFAAANPLVLKGKMDYPGFMRLNFVMPSEKQSFMWSAAVSPEKIRTGAKCPDDFDDFWRESIAEYDRTVPEDVTLEPVPQLDRGGLAAFKVTLSAPGGRKLYGLMTRPQDLSKGPFPLRFEGKGAGPASQGFAGSGGRVTLAMNVHYYDAPIPSAKNENGGLQELENREWFGRFRAKRAGYQVLGISGKRDDYFYHGVILATRRVFRWAARQQYVDAKDITYRSTSQGGGFGLYMAAMCPQIRKLAVFVPALTDLCGYQAGRRSGWPRLIEEQLDENRERAAANAPYYDAANFAVRVRCPVRVTVGFADDTCPPAAVYSAYNNLPAGDRAIWHGIGMTHLVRGEFYRRGEEWLAEKNDTAPRTPETSRLFERSEDALSGTVSYRLKPERVGFHQQSLYFTAKSMTDDGRFLVLDASDDPYANTRVKCNTETRRKFAVDFATDCIYPIGGASIDGQIPFLDTKADKLYYIGRDSRSVCVCDLKNDPQGETVLCRFEPSEFGDGAINRMATHLTLSSDRSKVFIDWSVGEGARKRWFIGMANLKTGRVEKWCETDFCSNHGSICPADDALGLFAYEGCWDKTVVGPDGKSVKVRRGPDEVYPRMWLATPDGTKTMQPSKIWNFATHENWTDDGRGFYWGAYHGGTAYQDLKSGVQSRVCPYWTIHSHLSANGKYVVFDQWANGDGFRGCGWQVGFWNRETGRLLAVNTHSPAIGTKERQSPLHPDAHPQFVCNDRYIVSTANDDRRRMSVLVTPVAALAAATSDRATAPRPRRLRIVGGGAGAECELEVDCAELCRRGLVAPARMRADVAWTAYAVMAKTAAGRVKLPLRAFIGGDRRPMVTTLRFAVPADATELDLVVNAPGRFEPADLDTLAKLPPAKRLELGDEPPPASWDGDWPKNCDPKTVSRRLSELFLSTRSDDYHPRGYALSDGSPQKGYGWRQCIFYATVSLWVNALECARKSGDKALEQRLVAAFEPYYGECAGHFPKFRHVDYSIVGAVPLEIALLTGDRRARKLGLGFADVQWAMPKADDPKPPMNQTPFEERMKLWKAGYSDCTRLWIDDAYMMTVLQELAYRVTGERRYIDRAAKEMCLYLDRLQLADGLFYHAPEAPHRWGRGNGWMAAGMPMVLKSLPKDSEWRERILAGYRQMAEALYAAQNEDGMWNQLVGDRESWEETSATAMFAYSFAAGAKNGWLDAAKYGPRARKAYLALVDRLDRFGNLPDVCAGTCTKDDREHYLKRPRINGDPHAQAPLLWLCSVLL